MNRHRSAGIIIQNEQVLLIRRINQGKEYWVFPGGGVEEGETADQAALREIDEETTVQARIRNLLYHITWDNNEENFYYLCEYISGEPKLREDTNEYLQMQTEDQVYEPIWVDIEQLPFLTVYQLEIRDLFLQDYKTGFPEEVRRLEIKIEERRRE